MTGHISEAVEQWAEQIAALGGSEALTRYRDLKVGTLDLHTADEDLRKRLLDGDPVRVSRLFPHEPVRSTAERSARRLAERLWRLETGHSIAAGYLVTGLASWADRTSPRRPSVPILLRRVQMLPIAFGESDVMIHVVGEPELNTRLLDAMAEQLGLRLTPADLLDPSGDLRYPVVVDRLREQAPPHVVDGFAIAHRAVIALMSSIADDVAADLRDPSAGLATRPLVALAAGAEGGTQVATDDDLADANGAVVPPIDVDSTQQRVLDAARTGSSLAVDAPAGAGATQVAAGICAEAVAAGRTVLVVAEASPRLRGLRRRLAAIGLGGATLDLADGMISTDNLARTVLSTVDSASARAGAPSSTAVRPRDPAAQDADRTVLSGYINALHEYRAPRALSAYQAISASYGGSPGSDSVVRLDPDALDRLDPASLEALRASLSEFVALDGLAISGQATAWFGAMPATSDDAEQAVALVDRLRTDLIPAARELGARAAVEVGMPSPAGPAELHTLCELLDAVRSVETVFDRSVWATPVDRLAVAMADRRSRRAVIDAPGLRERRALRAQAHELARGPEASVDTRSLATALETAAEVRHRWAGLARDGRLPRIGDHGPQAIDAEQQTQAAVQGLRDVHPDALPDDLDYAATLARLDVLAQESAWARRLPRLTAAAAELADAGLGPLVAELRDRRSSGATVTPDEAVAALDSCVAASLAEQIQSTDPVLARSDGQTLRAASERWRQADAAAVVARADAARSAWASRVLAAATERPVQVRALRDALAGHGPAGVRQFVAACFPTMVSARPIWLAGPLPVAAALPVDATFDLLVVLDAQSMALAHAVGALARARRVVVLGDPSQPPPSVTPLSVDAPDHQAIPSLPGSAVETPSVYAVLRDQLPAVDLTVRYGCRDGRLQVAMPSGRSPYEIAVPPGSSAASPLGWLHVEQEPGSRDQEESVTAEVVAVVGRVREHVAGRPQSSLAVVTVGRAHAQAIDAALARACATDPVLAAALGPDTDEPFLLSAVDDLCGQRRDTVILSVGYGRTMDGRVLYRFGALNRPGGVRWLTAAVAAARRELCVVSSLQATDLDPRRLAADGLRALRRLLADAEGIPVTDIPVEGAGADPAQGDAAPAAERQPHPAVRPRPLDPFERAVAERLHEAGLPVAAGAGTGILAVPLVIEHPGRPGRGVLVVETEGGAFGTIHTLRDRERMRPEQLMRSGWSVYRVCVLDYARDPDAELERIVAAWREACALADALDAARNTPGASPAGPAAGPAAHAGTPAVSEAGEPEPTRAHVRDARRSELPRPAIAVGRPVDTYPPHDLVDLAGWIDDVQPGVAEDEGTAALAAEVGLAHPTGRSERVLRRAVRAAAIMRSASAEPAPSPVMDGPTHDAGDKDGPTHDGDVTDGPTHGEDEWAGERAEEEAARERWLTEEKPPHH